MNFGQGKVSEKSVNFISDLKWTTCIKISPNPLPALDLNVSETKLFHFNGIFKI